MKQTKAAVDSRREKILERIHEYQTVQVDALAEEFQVSTMCIRRDLQYLEDQKIIRRFRGGASLLSKADPDTAKAEIQHCRDRIGRYAAQFVADGDTLFINGSLTALNMLQYVEAENVRVITNNAHASGQSYTRRIHTILTGGELFGHILVGEYVMRHLLECKASKTFIGCAGILGNGELCYNIPTEIGINEAMITRTTAEVYVLADHTKINYAAQQVRHYGSCLYECPWILITDTLADPQVIAQLRREGKTVHVV